MKIVQQIKAFLNIVYFLIRQFGLRPTNLKNIEDYRLEELIFKDIKAYPNSGFGEIHQRIGFEINP